MKILFFAPYFHPYLSGMTTMPFRLFTKLPQHHFTILTFRHQVSLPECETINNLTIIRMPVGLRLSKGFVSPQSLFYALRYLPSHQLLVLNLPNAEGLLFALIARLLGKRIVSLVHCQVYLKRNILSQILNYLLNTSMMLQLKLSHAITTYTLDYAKHNHLLTPHLHKNIPIIPLVYDQQATAHQKSSDFTVGFAGRLASEKGIEYLIKALLEFPHPYRLEIAGPAPREVIGETKYGLEIERLLRKHHIPHQFVGQLAETALADWYQSLHVLILPSINSTEAFGMVQLEAMLQGTPVIATNLPGVRIPIQATGMGILVPPGDPRAIEEALINIYQEPTRFHNATTSEKLTQFYQPDITLKAYDQLFH